MLKDNNIIALNSASANTVDNIPERFHERFDSNGAIISSHWPRITTEESELYFQSRHRGLQLLLINPPIREWSHPNIMPIGHGYVGAVAVMDGHKVDVLDLNAERGGPVTDAGSKFSVWVENEIINRLDKQKPDVIGIGGIITQYKLIKKIATICKRLCPDVPIVLGGGLASCFPEFMVARLPIDVA